MYDIALVKLNKPVTINNEVNNICLPQKWQSIHDSVVNDEYVNIGGWGAPTPILKLAYMKIRDFTLSPPSAGVYILDKQKACPVSSKQLSGNKHYNNVLVI